MEAIIVFLIVGFAAVYLVFRALRKIRMLSNSKAGNGCGCGACESRGMCTALKSALSECGELDTTSCCKRPPKK